MGQAVQLIGCETMSGQQQEQAGREEEYEEVAVSQWASYRGRSMMGKIFVDFCTNLRGKPYTVNTTIQNFDSNQYGCHNRKCYKNHYYSQFLGW